MTGQVTARVSRKRHQCSPPGWWQRRRLDLDYGSVWLCDCGQRWIWDYNLAGADWRPVKVDSTGE